MNERIKELARQAGCKVMDDGEWYIPSATGLEKIVYTSGVGLEKFAELIVKECARLCEHESNDDEYDQYDMGQSVKAESIKTAIKEHFGVEE